MLKLLDILGIDKNNYSDYKIHFATGAYDKMQPYNKFIINQFNEWQQLQTKKNFNRPFVISLIYYDKDIWMYGGIYKVSDFYPKKIIKNDYILWQYDLSLTNIQSDLIGRLFIKYKKEFRASYPNLELQCKNGISPKDMAVSYILDKRVSINDFTGFDNVNITYSTLKYIVENNIISWKNALSKVKGIYLIVDTLTGKQYVGSAYGNDCIWQRWCNYAKNGHGGNIELKNLLKENENYKHNFKYSILEICNMNLGNDYIISRENHWKEILMTRKFGLNDN